jgi:hypothetical protein
VFKILLSNLVIFVSLGGQKNVFVAPVSGSCNNIREPFLFLGGGGVGRELDH